MTRDEFVTTHLEPLFNDPDNALYIDPDTPTAATARAAITDVLHNPSPAATFLHSAEDANEGITPIYRLAEELPASQRAAVAAASRLRAAHITEALESTAASESKKTVSMTTDVGACVTMAADLTYANDMEGREDTEFHKMWTKRQFRLEENKTRREFGDLLDEIDDTGVARELANPPYNYGLLERLGKADIPKIIAALDECGYATQRDTGSVREQYFKQIPKFMGTAAQRREMAELIYATLYARKQHSLDLKLGNFADSSMDGFQEKAAREHAEYVRREMDAISPRETTSYTDIISPSSKSFPKAHKQTLDTVASFLPSGVLSEVNRDLTRGKNTLQVAKTTARPRYEGKYSYWGAQRTLRTTEDFPTALHETMHMIEDGNTRYRGAAVEFLRQRTRGLKAIRIAGGANGVGVVDDFSDHYVGRIYSEDARDEERRDPVDVYCGTEVLSCGAEFLATRMWGRKSMALFSSVRGRDEKPCTALYDDPEHMAFTIGMLTSGGVKRDRPGTLDD